MIYDSTDSSLLEKAPPIGGKALGLARITASGVATSPWICISADAAMQLNPELQSEILAGLDRLGIRSSKLAVRSSGLDEDSADHSFAGQFSSVLNVQGDTALFAAIQECWKSAYSERGLAYRKERGLPVTGIRMGVIIQKMVNADCAGVIFTRNPIHPLDRDHLLVSSVKGLAEGLVSGELDADEFTLTRSDQNLKSKSLVDPANPSVTEAQLQQVCKMALQIEKKLNAPQDCEWAIENGKVYFVQTRPITSIPTDAVFSESVNGSQAILWDNSNIIESFCGVTTPLTFSHASRAYRVVYREFCKVMGVTPALIEQHDSTTFANMLGFVRGRIYYNLVSWYQLLFLFPATSSSKSFMETMMGVKQSLRPELAALFDFTKNPPKYSAYHKIKLVLVTLTRLIRIKPLIAEFKSHINGLYERAYNTDFNSLSLRQQLDYYKVFEKEVLNHWKAPIINDTRCMLFFGLLKSLTAKWVDDSENSSVQNDLLCGQGDLESTEPTKMLMRIAASIEELGLTKWFVENALADKSLLWAALNAKSAEIYGLILDFQRRYGFRCVNEQKLEENDLHDDPTFILEAIAGYLRMKSYSITAMEEREKEIRTKAEEFVASRLSVFQKPVYHFVLKHARMAVKDREDLRFLRTKTFGITRRLFRAMARHLTALGVLQEPGDFFFLTVDEIQSLVEGRSVMLNYKPVIQERRREYEEYKRTPAPPDRFLTIGSAGLYFKSSAILSDSDLLKSDESASDDPDLLLGTACCPGIVEGVVRVAQTPKDAENLNGEILVTERTDPGWVPLFPSCSALLIERGSLLSHSAVVARELGLPTIVGVSGGLMRKLKTGMRVRIDAGRGQIRILR